MQPQRMCPGSSVRKARGTVIILLDPSAWLLPQIPTHPVINDRDIIGYALLTKTWQVYSTVPFRLKWGGFSQGEGALCRRYRYFTEVQNTIPERVAIRRDW